MSHVSLTDRVLAALRELGGSAKPREVVDLVVERLETAMTSELSGRRVVRSGSSIHWARNYLVWAGLLDGSQRGKWALSPEGWAVPLEKQDRESALQLFKQVRAEHSGDWGQSPGGDSEEDGESEEPPVALTKEESGEMALTTGLRSTVFALSSAGFENLCKRLLTELGLVQLRTVGQAGDRGIDVEGHLRINAVVTFRVGVQCKLYSDGNKVTPRQIREFQGAWPLRPWDLHDHQRLHATGRGPVGVTRVQAD